LAAPNLLTVLLTGATGFLGSALLPRLLEAGHRVICLGRREPRTKHANVTFIPCHFGRDLPELSIDWAAIDAVLHLAASGVKAAHRTWLDCLQFNVVGTRRLLDVLGASATRSPAFLMTQTFYEQLCGEHPQLLENPYIATKHAASALVESWAASYRGRVALAAIFQVYGPGDDPGSVLPYAARQLSRGAPAQFGSGRGLRDWIYVDDAVSAIMATLQCISGPFPGPLLTVDIGTGELRSIRDMVERLALLTGLETAPLLDFDATRDRDDVSPTLAAAHLIDGWQPLVDCDEGLKRLIESERAQSHLLLS